MTAYIVTRLQHAQLTTKQTLQMLQGDSAEGKIQRGGFYGLRIITVIWKGKVSLRGKLQEASRRVDVWSYG